MNNLFSKIYNNILIKQNIILEEKQDFIDVFPYMIQFKNFNDSSSQLKIIREIVNILENLAQQYNINKKTIVHDTLKSLPATYCIQWQATTYTQPLHIWNKIYNELLKNNTENKWIFWKSLLSNKSPKIGYFRPGHAIEEKLGDKFKPTRLQIYFNEQVKIKLIFDNISYIQQPRMNDNIIQKYIDNKLNKIENLSIIKKQYIKDKDSYNYIINYSLKDQTQFSDILNKTLGKNWHPEGDGYSFCYTNS